MSTPLEIANACVPSAESELPILPHARAILVGVAADRIAAEFADKDALIERLQKELKEARDKLNVAVLDGAAAAWDKDTIRAKTIEECAQIADARVLWLEEKFGTEATAERVELEMIAKAIRSIDGGGK